MSASGSDRPGVREDDLHAYVDGQLDADARRALEALLVDDPGASARAADWTAQNAALRRAFDPVLHEPLPPAMRRTLEKARRGGASGGGFAPWAMRLAAAAAWVMVGGAVGFGAARWGGVGAPAETSPSLSAALPVEAASAYRVYISERRHVVEVPAAEVDHLTNWLSNKMKTKVRPPDLAPLGWKLLGGRLLASTAAGPACLFVYENAAGKRVMVYLVSNANNEGTTVQFRDRDGVRSLSWLEGPLGYALSGDLDRDSLAPIAAVVREKMKF